MQHLEPEVSARGQWKGAKLLSAFVGLCACMAAMAAPGAGANDDQQAARAADQAFVQALDQRKSQAAGALLASGFTWTDLTGRTESGEKFLKRLSPVPAGKRDEQVHAYNSVVFFTGAEKTPGEHVRFVRVWVKEPAGWRILLGQETKIAGKAATPQATVRAGTTCENPCKTVPYQAKTAAAQEVVESWQALETAVNGRDADEWARHVGDEFVFNVKEDGNPLTKADRVATIRKQAEGNTVTDIGAVVPNSMDVQVFGDTAVMRDTQQPTTGGNPYRAMRIWVKRDRRWQLVYSQQTTIEQPSTAMTR